MGCNQSPQVNPSITPLPNSSLPQGQNGPNSAPQTTQPVVKANAKVIENLKLEQKPFEPVKVKSRAPPEVPEAVLVAAGPKKAAHRAKLAGTGDAGTTPATNPGAKPAPSPAANPANNGPSNSEQLNKADKLIEARDYPGARAAYLLVKPQD